MSRLLSIALICIGTAIFGLTGCEPAPQESASPDGRAQLAEFENYKDFGRYVVHVNALTTSQLPADIAQNYGIVRSGNRALLNVTVLKKSESLTDMPVAAEVAVSAANLTGQNKGMKMREVTDGQSIYYIGEASVSNGEVLLFDLDVTPEGESEALSLRFKKEFFGG